MWVAVADCGNPRGELGVVDQRRGVGVVQEIVEFALYIAEAAVERCHACAVAAEHGFEVLVAIAQIQGQMILAGFVAREMGTFDPTAQS